jgi:dTMP kinase
LNNKNLQKKFSGKFIVLDGPDGCGKTTQLKLLADYLKNQGIEVVKAHDPGSTAIGDKIRKLVKYGSKDIDVRTEVMLFMASRAQLAADVIEPALKKGKTVLCDRYISSTCAYQGAGGYSIEKILELGRFAVGDTWPDLTVVLDLPPKKGRERTGVTRGKKIEGDYEQNHFFDSPTVDIFDSRPLEYHRKVRKEFLRLPDYYPGLVKIVDGSQGDIEAVHEKLKQVIGETHL